MEINTNELKDYIKNICKAIENADTETINLKSPIEFELAVITKKEGKGKVNIFVVDAGGKYEKEAISKIKFSMGYKASFGVVRSKRR